MTVAASVLVLGFPLVTTNSCARGTESMIDVALRGRASQPEWAIGADSRPGGVLAMQCEKSGPLGMRSYLQVSARVIRLLLDTESVRMPDSRLKSSDLLAARAFTDTGSSCDCDRGFSAWREAGEARGGSGGVVDEHASAAMYQVGMSAIGVEEVSVVRS
jgi:hypothetical protein